MKSFLSAALLAVMVAADDAADKAAVADKNQTGTTIEKMQNAIARPDITINTGTPKATLSLVTGWRVTTGSDAETYLGFAWQIDPEDAYDPKAAKLDIAFAKDKTTAEVNYTRFSRTITSS